MPGGARGKENGAFRRGHRAPAGRCRDRRREAPCLTAKAKESKRGTKGGVREDSPSSPDLASVDIPASAASSPPGNLAQTPPQRLASLPLLPRLFVSLPAKVGGNGGLALCVFCACSTLEIPTLAGGEPPGLCANPLRLAQVRTGERAPPAVSKSSSR